HASLPRAPRGCYWLDRATCQIPPQCDVHHWICDPVIALTNLVAEGRPSAAQRHAGASRGARDPHVRSAHVEAEQPQERSEEGLVLPLHQGMHDDREQRTEHCVEHVTQRDVQTEERWRQAGGADGEVREAGAGSSDLVSLVEV